MPSHNSKYTQEIREQTARYVLESGKSATSVAEEMGIGVETICKWVRTYRKSHNMPSYAEEKGIQKKAAQTEGELLYKIKELERGLRKKEKELSDEKEKVEILKKSLHMLISKHFQFIHMGSTIMFFLHIVEQGSIRLTPMHKREVLTRIYFCNQPL